VTSASFKINMSPRPFRHNPLNRACGPTLCVSRRRSAILKAEVCRHWKPKRTPVCDVPVHESSTKYLRRRWIPHFIEGHLADSLRQHCLGMGRKCDGGFVAVIWYLDKGMPIRVKRRVKRGVNASDNRLRFARVLHLDVDGWWRTARSIDGENHCRIWTVGTINEHANGRNLRAGSVENHIGRNNQDDYRDDSNQLASGTRERFAMMGTH